MAVLAATCGIWWTDPTDLLSDRLSKPAVAFVAATWLLIQAVSKGSDDRAEVAAAAEIFDLVAALAATVALAYLTAEYTAEQFRAIFDGEPSTQHNVGPFVAAVALLVIAVVALAVIVPGKREQMASEAAASHAAAEEAARKAAKQALRAEASDQWDEQARD